MKKTYKLELEVALDEADEQKIIAAARLHFLSTGHAEPPVGEDGLLGKSCTVLTRKPDVNKLQGIPPQRFLRPTRALPTLPEFKMPGAETATRDGEEIWKLFRERGAEGFYAAKPRHSSASVLKGEVLQRAQPWLDAGRSVPEVARELSVLANTLQKAIRAGRLRKGQKKRNWP